MLKEGDRVIFNCNENARTVLSTPRLMKRYLTENKIYTVEETMGSNRNTDDIERHIRLCEEESLGYWYPESCFSLVDKDHIIIDLSE